MGPWEFFVLRNQLEMAAKTQKRRMGQIPRFKWLGGGLDVLW